MANPKQTAKAKSPAKQTKGMAIAASKKPAAKAKTASKAKAKKTAPVVDNSLQVAHYVRNMNS